MRSASSMTEIALSSSIHSSVLILVATAIAPPVRLRTARLPLLVPALVPAALHRSKLLCSRRSPARRPAPPAGLPPPPGRGPFGLLLVAYLSEGDREAGHHRTQTAHQTGQRGSDDACKLGRQDLATRQPREATEVVRSKNTALEEPALHLQDVRPAAERVEDLGGQRGIPPHERERGRAARPRAP